MSGLEHLIENNREWVSGITKQRPDFFFKLAEQQNPKYLWIGCADSRVPANEIVGLLPGEMFVHRNIANLVVHSDLNCLSVLQYAVEVLKVEHVIVCGHYGCGGIAAAYDGVRLGLIDNWLRYVQDVRSSHAGILDALGDPKAARARLCELNVIEQVKHVCETSIVQEAWRGGHAVKIHGWIYDVRDGLLHDLGMSVQNNRELELHYVTVIEKYAR